MPRTFVYLKLRQHSVRRRTPVGNPLPVIAPTWSFCSVLFRGRDLLSQRVSFSPFRALGRVPGSQTGWRVCGDIRTPPTPPCATTGNNGQARVRRQVLRQQRLFNRAGSLVPRSPAGISGGAAAILYFSHCRWVEAAPVPGDTPEEFVSTHAWPQSVDVQLPSRNGVKRVF